MTNITADSIVIVGAGQAGARVAGGLRSVGFSGDITVFGEEPHLPYERPPLSKRVLCGEVSEADCRLYDSDFYADNRIALRLGSPVTAIDRQARLVTNDRGEVQAYDRLAIATGASPRRLQCDVSDETGVHYVRTIDHVRHLKAELTPGRKILVVGAGLIGLEVAAIAARLGCSVHVVEASGVPMGRAVPPAIGAAVVEVHRQNGVEFTYAVQVVSVSGRRGHYRVRVSDDQEFLCHSIVVGIGAIPNVALAERAGLAVSNGICVNEYLQSSDPSILALGDVCAFPDDRLETSIRLESWRNAEEQAATVVACLAGAPLAYRPVPWFWSDQYDLTLQVVGHPARGRRSLQVEAAADCLAEAYVDDSGQIVGAAALADLASVAKEIKIAERLIKSGARLSDADINAQRLNLRNLFDRTRRESRVANA